MGSRGPQRIPTAILEKRGSWLVDTRKGEPGMLKPEIPDPPNYLKGKSKKLWVELVTDLDRLDILQRVDAMALGRYCQLMIEWLDLKAEIEKRPSLQYTVKDKQGNVTGVKLFPDVKLYYSLQQRLLQLEREFGMTPSSRTGVRTNQFLDEQEDIINTDGKTVTKKEDKSGFFD